jgi:hypothetical protein
MDLHTFSKEAVMLFVGVPNLFSYLLYKPRFNYSDIF